MVSTRPTDSYEWAEGTPPAIDGTNPPTDPGAGRRSSGYGFEERLPHESFNWIIRTLGRWIGWLEEKVDGHVHDGGSSEASVAKVSFNDHISYGTNGQIVIDVDTAVAHEIVHDHLGGGTAKFTTDILESVNASFASVGTSAVTTSSCIVNGPFQSNDVARFNDKIENSLVPDAIIKVNSGGTLISIEGLPAAALTITKPATGTYVLSFAADVYGFQLTVEPTDPLADPTLVTGFMNGSCYQINSTDIAVHTFSPAGTLTDTRFIISVYKVY